VGGLYSGNQASATDQSDNHGNTISWSLGLCRFAAGPAGDRRWHNGVPGPVSLLETAHALKHIAMRIISPSRPLLSSPRTRPGGAFFFCRNAKRGEHRNSSITVYHWHIRFTRMPVSRHLGCNDQNSAGRYPLISRPMHTSTSVGVVHNISALPLLVVGRDPFILNAPPPP
jgi:hypothetical protein